MKTIKFKLLLISALIISINSCVKVIRPGEVGVKRTFGRLKDRTYTQGLYVINPFASRMLKVPTRTLNLHLRLESLPTKEGLVIESEFAVLYHTEAEFARKIVETIGVRNAIDILTSVARSAAADVTARFYAKDLHTTERQKIETEIANEMKRILGDRGLIIEAVLLKSIRLPQGLSKAIEDKLTAEQEAQRMEYILTREKLEAERRKIEAIGIRDAQKIISEGLNANIIQYRSIEAFEKLSNSPNAKTIILNGNNPIIVQPEK